MKLLTLAMMALLFCHNTFSSKSDEIQSALAWLHLIDVGDYDESWRQSAPFFQNQISNQKWIEALQNTRIPLGEALSRKVVSHDNHSTIAGLPSGRYLVIKIDTEFEKMPAATETITLNKVDSTWRVIGYYIKQ